MENATDALLMAFAVLVFVVALSVTFSTLAQAKSTADVVLFYSDRENFQTPLKDDTTNVQNGGRTVGVDTVIATISRCIKENFTVRINEDTDDEYEYIFEYSIDSKDKIQQKISEFISTHIGTDSKYRETYVEVTISGTTYTAEDGTILEENVGKKLYITYEKKHS